MAQREGHQTPCGEDYESYEYDSLLSTQKTPEETVHQPQTIDYFNLESNCIPIHVVQSPRETEAGKKNEKLCGKPTQCILYTASMHLVFCSYTRTHIRQ